MFWKNLEWNEFISSIFADFDGDNFVGASDIENAVKLLTQNELSLDEIESIWEKVKAQILMINTISLFIKENSLLFMQS